MSHLVAGPELSRVRHHGPAAVLAAAATVALVVAPDRYGLTGLVVTVAVLQLALVVSWGAALGFRGHLGAGVLGAGTAIAADIVLVRSEDDALAPLAAVLALAIVASFAHQLLRSPPRLEVSDSLAGDALLAVAVVALSAYVVLYRVTDGTVLLDACVAAVGAAVVVGHLLDLVAPYPRIVEGVPRGLLGFLAGTGAAVLAAIWRAGATELVERLGAIILGGILGGVAGLIAIGASYAAAERRGRGPAQACVQAVLPFAATAPVAYFLSLVVSG
ncbi:hypothetical protein BH20ACT5_BH20ACT5_16690 [soil metagenome]